jgi:hypothetical protein
LSAAILTPIIIPDIDILSAKPYRLPWPPNESQQPDYGGQLDCETYGMYLLIVFLKHLHFAKGQHNDRPLPVYDLEGLIGNI